MKSKWNIKRISDLAEINPRESIRKGTVAKKVPMDVLQPFTRDVSSFQYEKFKGGTKFRNKDTIMARITPCLENGKIAQVRCLDSDEIGFGSTEYIVFRAKSGTDPDFLYYLICSPLVREPSIKSMIGSSGRQRVQTDVVSNLQVAVPGIEKQKHIGSLLKALDDKIYLNTKINKNLIQQSQALYSAWFEQFLPFDGSMPSDWRIGTLGDIATIKTNSFNPQKNPGVMLEHYSIPAYDEQHFPFFESSDNVKSNKYILTDNSVLASKLNPDTKRIWRPMCLTGQAVCSTEFIVFEANNSAHRDFLFSIIDSQFFSDWMCAHTTGSTNSRQRTTPSTTLEFKVNVAPDDVIDEFCASVTPMYDLISQNLLENQGLASLRDSLLPKLMSGEIDVSNIEL